MISYTIDEAMMFGHGVERPFLCPVHDDHNPSASINSITGLWFCYSCGAKGKYDTTVIDSDTFHRQLEMFLDLEEERKEYPEAYLNQYDALGPGEYWLSRFSLQVCRLHRLGQSYDGRYATIPVRDERGVLLGVVRRDLTGTDEMKYRYPYRLKISQLLYNYSRCTGDTIILTEGATDAIAAEEIGLEAMATYRNGMSLAQYDMMRRYRPKRVFIAYDQDPAGERGAEQITAVLKDFTEVHRLSWDGYKDLASIPVEDRKNLRKVLDNLAQV